MSAEWGWGRAGRLALAATPLPAAAGAAGAGEAGAAAAGLWRAAAAAPARLINCRALSMSGRLCAAAAWPAMAVAIWQPTCGQQQAAGLLARVCRPQQQQRTRLAGACRAWHTTRPPTRHTRWLSKGVRTAAPSTQHMHAGLTPRHGA